MAELNQRDIEVLQSYADGKNRLLYWNYLAQHTGNDGYGLLALGVVRNDSMPGATANAFAQHHAFQRNGRQLSERQWEEFGQNLIQEDLARRKVQMEKHRPDLALNLPSEDVQAAHDASFYQAEIDRDAWTPRQLLDAARRHGGEPAADAVWRTMLDNQALGLHRMTQTLADVAWRYNDEKLNALSYTAALTAATTQAWRDRAAVDPNIIGNQDFYYAYAPRTGEWSSVSNNPHGLPAVRRVTDQSTLDGLDDARAVRLERQKKSTDFDLRDPHREIARSPFTLADATPSQAPEQRVSSLDAPGLPQAPAFSPFARLMEAASNRDISAMRAVSQDYLHSEDGQAWLQSGREHNLALQQQQAAQQEALDRAAQRSPVMSL